MGSVVLTDVSGMDWTAQMFGGRSKRLFEGADGSHLDYVDFSGNAAWDRNDPGKGPHYHTYHEWAYCLSGHFVIYEFVHPRQIEGELVHFREGTFMSRPAYSLHAAQGHPRSAFRQGPCVLLNYEEGPSEVLLAGPDNVPDDVVDWPDNFIRQTATTLEWEADPELGGASMKWLREDPIGGFRAKLRHVPPGWVAPAEMRATYHERAHRFAYVIAGDMTLLVGDVGTAVGSDWFIEQPPGTVWAWEYGSASETGCMWLEATYASGTTLSSGRVEDPIAVGN